MVERLAVGPLIIKLLEERNWSQNELARRSGIQASYLSQIITGKTRNVRSEYAIAIAKAFGISVDELLGLTTYAKPDELTELKSVVKEMVEAYKFSDIIKIPLRGSVPARYSSIEEENTGEFIALSRRDLPPYTYRLYAVRVSGNSLADDGIQDGDLLIVEETNDILEGKIYVLRLGNEVIARHVYRQNNELKLVSSNNKYQIIKANEAEIRGRVIFSERRTTH